MILVDVPGVTRVSSRINLSTPPLAHSTHVQVMHGSRIGNAVDKNTIMSQYAVLFINANEASGSRCQYSAESQLVHANTSIVMLR